MIWLGVRTVGLKNLNLLINVSLKSTIKCSIRQSTTNQFKQASKRKMDFERNIFVYELTDSRQIVTTTLAGWTAFAFTLYFSMMVQNLNTIDKHVSQDEFVEDQLSRKVFYWVSQFVSNHSKAVGIFSLCFGTVITFCCQLYCISSIKSITLLKGGDQLIVQLFRSNPLSSNFKKLNVPLKDVCFHGSRIDNLKTIQCSVYNHMGYYILHKSYGQFNEPVFDKVVGLHRDIKLRKKN